MGDNNLFCVIFQKEGDVLNAIYHGQISGEGVSRVIGSRDRSGSVGDSDSVGTITSADGFNQFQSSMGREFKITDEMVKDIQKDSGLVFKTLMNNINNNGLSNDTIDTITLLIGEYAEKYGDENMKRGLKIGHTLAQMPGAASLAAAGAGFAVNQIKPVIDQFRKQIENSDGFKALDNDLQATMLNKINYFKENAGEIIKEGVNIYGKSKEAKKQMLEEKRKNVTAAADSKDEKDRQNEDAASLQEVDKKNKMTGENPEETVDHTAADSKDENAETNVEEENKDNEDGVGKGEKTNEEAARQEAERLATEEAAADDNKNTGASGGGRRTKRKSKHHRRRKNKSKNKKR
jgi:hypothetical protein